MASATAMWYSGKNPLKKVTRTSEEVHIPKGLKVRRLHKAFLRYHDANNWPTLREALKRMGRADLIGSGRHHLIPAWQPAGTGDAHEGSRQPQKFRTQHTGLKGVALPQAKKNDLPQKRVTNGNPARAKNAKGQSRKPH
jgi:hypothetical protein